MRYCLAVFDQGVRSLSRHANDHSYMKKIKDVLGLNEGFPDSKIVQAVSYNIFSVSHSQVHYPSVQR
jgi:hypothetical protein